MILNLRLPKASHMPRDAQAPKCGGPVTPLPWALLEYPNHHKLFFSPIIYSQNEQSKRSGQAPKFKKVNQNFKDMSKALNFEQGQNDALFKT